MVCFALQLPIGLKGSSKTQRCPESDDVHENDVADSQWQHRVAGTPDIDNICSATAVVTWSTSVWVTLT